MTTRLFMLSPKVIFRAHISLGDLPIYPLDLLPYNSVISGSASNVIPGMTVLIDSSSTTLDVNSGRQRVRAAASGTTIPIGRSSQGAFDGQVDIQDGYFVTVLEDYRVWAKNQVIDPPPTNTIYKDSNVAASGEVNDPRPVANGGPGFAGTIDRVSRILTVDFDGTHSFQFDTPITASMSAVDAYLWNVGDGTIITGSTTTSTMTATFPPGFRYVSLKVTASSGKTHTCYIPVFARDPDNDICLAHQISSHHITQYGQEIGLRLLEPVLPTVYPDGTLVMLWEESITGIHEGMTFIGWEQSDSSTRRSEEHGTSADTTINCVDVVGRLRKLPGMSQVVNSSKIKVTVAAPGAPISSGLLPVLPLNAPIPSGTVLNFGGFSGSQTATLTGGAPLGSTSLTVSSLPHTINEGQFTTITVTPPSWYYTRFPNILYYIWFMLYWHSTALEVTDLLLGTQTLSSFPFMQLGSNEDSIFEQANSLAQLIEPDHYLNCRRTGQMILAGNPNLLDLGDRPAATSIIFTDSDYTQISFTDERSPKVYRLETWAIVSDSTYESAVACIAPGLTPGQGGQSIARKRAYTVGQGSLNITEGHRYAMLNARLSATMTIPYPRLDPSIEPADMKYVQLNSEDKTPRPMPYVPFNFGLISEINISYDYEETGWSRTATLTWVQMTVGTPAVTRSVADSEAIFS